MKKYKITYRIETVIDESDKSMLKATAWDAITKNHVKIALNPKSRNLEDKHLVIREIK